MDLVERAQHGDHLAFDSLVASRIDRLYGVARLIVRDPVAAEDAVQEALVRAWRSLPGLRDPERFDAWLRRLLVRACYDEANRRTRRWRMEVDIETVDFASEDVAGAVEHDAFERAFTRLSPAHRAVLVVQHHLGLSVAEAAEALGIPPGTVKSRTHFALQALRATLEAEARLAPLAGQTP